MHRKRSFGNLAYLVISSHLLDMVADKGTLALGAHNNAVLRFHRWLRLRSGTVIDDSYLRPFKMLELHSRSTLS